MNNRTIHVAFVLSVLVHIAAMWLWHPQLHPTFERKRTADESGPLQLRLESAPQVPPAPAAKPAVPQKREEPPPMPRAAKPKPPAPKPRPAPKARPSEPAPRPFVPMTKPAPPAVPPDYSAPVPAASAKPLAPPEVAPAPVPAPTPAPEPPAAAPGADLSSYIASRRRARQRSESPAVPRPPAAVPESEEARANRIASANLGVGRTPSFGQDATGGGIFQIQRVGYDYAEYLFYGWNADIRRNATQLITVRKGTQADIRIAVVRSMIEIIRRHEQGDFLWESRRLGRNVNLSARPADDAGLQDFLMQEFFGEERRPALAP